MSFRRVIDIYHCERARFNNVVFQRNGEKIRVKSGGEIRKNLEIVEEADVDVYGDLGRRLNRRFFHTLPSAVVDRSYERVADFILRTGKIPDEGYGIFLNK